MAAARVRGIDPVRTTAVVETFDLAGHGVSDERVNVRQLVHYRAGASGAHARVPALCKQDSHSRSRVPDPRSVGVGRCAPSILAISFCVLPRFGPLWIPLAALGICL